MNIFTKEISFKKVLIALLAFYTIFLSACFIILGGNELFSLRSLLLTLAIVVVISAFLFFVKGSLFVQISLFIIFFILYILPRIYSFLIFPDKINFPFGNVITSYELNYGLWYLLLGTVAILLGFLCAAFLLPKDRKNPSPQVRNKLHFNTNSLLLVFLVSILVDLYVQSFLGINFLNKLRDDKNNVFIQLINVIFNIDIIFFMVMVSLISAINKENKTKNLIAILLVTSLYILFGVFYGSRSTGLRVLIMLVVISFSLNWKFRATLPKYLSVILIFSLVSFLSYPLATQIRLHRASQFCYKSQNEKQKSEQKIIKFNKVDTVGLGLFRDLESFFYTVANRFGVVDYEILVLTQEPDFQAKKRFINLPYITKSIVNALVPGEPYQDATLSTSRLVTVLYRGFTEEYVKTHGYFSEYYTPWGIFFLLFGWWGGLAGLFVSGFLIHGLYIFIVRYSGKFSLHLGSLYLLTVPLLFYGNSGIDHWISNSIILAASGVAALFLSFIFDKGYHYSVIVKKDFNRQ